MANRINGTWRDDTLTGTAGDDDIRGQSGNDTITAGDGDDSVRGASGADIIDGGAGNDSIDAGSQDDFVTGGAGNDTIDGQSGADTIEAGAGNDLIDGGSQNDQIWGDEGNDTIDAGSEQDLVSGGRGNDVIDGESGDDSLFGGLGDDTIEGGFGNDWMEGGAGDDLLHAGGYGAGNDTIVFGPGFGDDTVDGFDPTTGFIHIGDADPSDVTFTATADPQVWVLTLDGVPDASLTLDFTFYWNTSLDAADLGARVITSTQATLPTDPYAEAICLTAGALVETVSGTRPAAMLKRGDLIKTLDAGYQPIRAVLRRVVMAAEMRANPALRPVYIPRNGFGAGKPEREMLVSLQHCFLGCHRDTHDEVLIRARHLAEMMDRGQVTSDEAPQSVTYIHVVLDRHHLIRANGVWTETVFAGPRALAADAVLRDMVAGADLPAMGGTVRPVLTRRDLRQTSDYIVGRRRGARLRKAV